LHFDFVLINCINKLKYFNMKMNYIKLGFAIALTSIIVTGCDDAKTDEAKPNNTNTEEPFMASTSATMRVAVLEDFTGVRCGFCPDGHVRATAAQQELGADKFIIMAVHGGSYATPATGWANFTTAFGSALISQSSVAGYPAGTINRIKAADLGVAPQISGGIAMSRGSWKTAAQAVNAMPSPVNLGAKAEFNSATRELTVKVDAYYTAEETAPNNINVAFMQSKLMSKQSGATTDPYEQNHVLRHLITGQWGEVITDSKATGTKVRKTYTYSVPEDYNGTATEGGGAVVIENCKVVVFVSRDKTDILTAVEIPITVK
jgi:hypothetical protein